MAKKNRKIIVLDFTRLFITETEKFIDEYGGEYFNWVYNHLKATLGDAFVFEDYFCFNEALLEKLKALKKQGLEFYIFAQGNIQFDPHVIQRLKRIIPRKNIFSPGDFEYKNKRNSMVFEALVRRIYKSELKNEYDSLGALIEAIKDSIYFIEKENCQTAVKYLGLEVIDLGDHHGNLSELVLKAVDAIIAEFERLESEVVAEVKVS